MPSWKKLLTSGSDVSVNNLNAQGIRFLGGSTQLAMSASGTSLGIGDLHNNGSYDQVVISGTAGLQLPGVNAESYIMNDVDVSLMLNSSNQVGIRQLGSNAFTSTTIGTTTNAVTVDNTTLQLNSGTTFNGSAARTVSAKTAAIANGGSGLATADQIHTFVTTQTDAIDADTAGNAATATKLASSVNIAGVAFDGSENISLNNNAITNGAGYTTATGTVDTSGTPADNDFAKFTDANTIEGRSIAETKSDLSLNNVENTAISTFAGSSNITTVGTIGTGTWNGTAIASAYLDSDTAHLSGTQTFSGAKTFSSEATFTAGIQLNDSDIITLGTGNDYEILDDGTDTLFRGKRHEGKLFFQMENDGGTNQNAIIIGSSGSAKDVGVELRYNNVGRIWTTTNGSAILKPSIMGLSDQESETTTLMINGSNVVGTRELGSNAFTSTTIGTTSNALTVDNTTIQLNSGTTFNGSGARTISAKTAAIANGGSGLATADQIHTFVTTQTDAIDADTAGNAATATALATAREIAGVSFNGTANISLNNNAITNGAGYTTNTGTVDTSGTPVDNDYAKFTDANTIEGRSASEVKTDLSLNNVENTAISTFAGSSNITTVGTIGTGTWQGTAIASAYLDSDTAHLSGTQTFSGAKTFSSDVVVPSIKVDTDGGIKDSEGVQAIQIDDSANVEIPSGLLTVSGTGTSNFTSHLKAHCLGIGTNPSTTQGEIRATNDITAYYSSDIRLKENIHSLKGTLEKLDSIRAVSYDWKELTEEERKTVHSHTGSDIGVIAQEVEEVFPDLVEDRPNGYKAVNYEKLSAVLLSAVKELKQEVEELKQKIK